MWGSGVVDWMKRYEKWIFSQPILLKKNGRWQPFAASHLHHLHTPRDLLMAKFTARTKKPRARALRAMSRSSRKMPGRVSFGPTGHFQHFRISFLLLNGDFLMGFPVPWHNWHLGGETEGQGGWWWFLKIRMFF